MKPFAILVTLMTLFSLPLWAQEEREPEPKAHLSRFDGSEWSAMKIDSRSLIPLLASGKAVLVDIRREDEIALLRFEFALMIPLEELPESLVELPKDKMIVLGCPHTDRAMIAVTYLKAEGFNALYLSDGLVGLAKNLKGEMSPNVAQRKKALKTRPLP